MLTECVSMKFDQEIKSNDIGSTVSVDFDTGKLKIHEQSLYPIGFIVDVKGDHEAVIQISRTGLENYSKRQARYDKLKKVYKSAKIS